MADDSKATSNQQPGTSPPSPKASEGRLREPYYQDELDVLEAG
jgi:hypothetical protein